MSMTQKLPPTFPLRLILIVSSVLCLCGTGAVVFGILSVKHQTWGYNWGTGFWCGAVTLAAGVCGIVASHARDICSMKTFMIFAVFGGVTSLIMLALSAGGLDTSSGMYDDTHNSKHMTLVVHAGCLGISLLQLILFILADGICIYFLLIEKRSTLFSLKSTPGNKPVPIPHRKKPKRCKSGTQTDRKPKAKNKEKKMKQKPVPQTDNVDDLETPLRDNIDRTLTQSRLEALPNSSPFRGHTNRNSFTTFGHSSVAEQESLIVHPDDDVFTLRSESRASNRDEGHYAQTVLFEPPLPIEEDEELPPYEAVDSSPYNTAVTINSSDGATGFIRRTKNRLKGPLTYLSNEMTRTAEHASSQRGRISTRNEIPHGRIDPNTSPDQKTVMDKTSNTQLGNEPLYAVPQPRRSRSADLLSTENDNDIIETCPQGVIVRDFGRSTDKISPRTQRSQSFRTPKSDREKRLERRNRALSMELKKPSKASEENSFTRQTPSTDSLNFGLFAENRVMPTKFSLRTPLRQVGTPYIPSVVPVKSISSLPIFQPPAKPPRTHSVTAEDLESSDKKNFVNDDVSSKMDGVLIAENTPAPGRCQSTDDKEDETVVKKTYYELENKMHTDRTSNAPVDGRPRDNEQTMNHEILPNCWTNETFQKRSELKVTKSPGIKGSKTSETDGSVNKVKKDLDSPTENRSKPSNSVSGFRLSMTVPSSPILKEVTREPNRTKDEDTRMNPIPKARTSLRSAEKYCQQNQAKGKDTVEISLADKTDKSEKAKNVFTTDDLSDLRVSLPPLKSVSIGSTSPSQKILKAKCPKKEPENTKQESEITNTIVERVEMAMANSPSVTVSRSQTVEYKGARPKIIPRTTSSMRVKPNTEMPSSIKLAKPGVSSGVGKIDTKISDSGARPKQFQSVQKKPISNKLPSKTSTSGASTLVTTMQISAGLILMPLSQTQNVGSQNTTRSVSASGTAAAGRSQGVLRLPQTQYSRQVSVGETQPSGANNGNNNVPVNIQNIGNQQNANTENLIISKFL